MTTFSMPIVLDQYTYLMSIARQYGVKGFNFGGCVKLNYKGTCTAMRRSAHAHCFPIWRGKELENYGWICVKSSKFEKLFKKDGKPNELFWHEVSHIYRRSRTQQECDQWARHMVRVF
jgi:hypothetical protein